MKIRRLMRLLLAIAGLAVPPVLAKGASTGRFARFLRYDCEHALGATRFDVRAPDRKNEDPELSLRCVRPVSGGRRRVCGWHWPGVRDPSGMEARG